MLECTTCKFAKNAFRVYHRLRRDNFEPLWRKASLLQIAKDRFVTWRWPGLKNGTFHIDPLNHKSRAGVLVGADFFQPQAAAQAGLRQGYGCGSRIPVDLSGKSILLRPTSRYNQFGEATNDTEFPLAKLERSDRNTRTHEPGHGHGCRK